MFEWMAWTTPVAVFFTCIVLMIAGMTVWEIKSPTLVRRGFLPMDTTRGDRLFIGLLAAAYLNLAFVGLSGWLAQWLSLESDPSIWFSFVASMVMLVWIMRKG
jgi:predicted small integral membrane protein